jgi:hypothetical protein
LVADGGAAGRLVARVAARGSLLLALVAIPAGVPPAVAQGAAGEAPRVLLVGPDRALKTPSAAAAVARDGDTIRIEAGDYVGDFAVWRRNRLTIEAAGGEVRMVAPPGPEFHRPGIWVVRGNDTIIAGIAFSGARSAQHNGAGIRLFGRNLTVRRCSFRDNEMGLLTWRDAESEVTVEHSVFVGNAADYERHGRLGHQLYVGAIRRLTLRYSYFDKPSVGHNVKSRAAENLILYNRIVDGAKGGGSYLIDLPNGGAAVVMGNELRKGAHAENEAAIAFAAESERHPGAGLFVVNNTFVNARLLGVFVRNFSASTPARIVNNLIAGPAVLAEGLSNAQRNLHANPAAFVDLPGGDLRLAPGVGAIDTGVRLEPAGGFVLVPDAAYSHPAGRASRTVRGAIDLGAHEFAPR